MSAPTPRPYTDAELNAAAEVLYQQEANDDDRSVAAYILHAVLPGHDAQVRADERARVAEEIAAALEHFQPEAANLDIRYGTAMEHAATVARLHATPPTTEEEHHAG